MDEPWTQRFADAVGGIAKKAMALARSEEREMPQAAGPVMELQSRLLADSLDRDDKASNRSGVFPVYFQIPTDGALYHFGRAMIVAESPRLTFDYARTSVFSGLCFLILMGLAGLGWMKRAKLAAALTPFKKPLFRKHTDD
jgi:hypothetical protein